MSNSARARARDARRRLQLAADILRRWDPIGIAPGAGGPIDEYDGYAPEFVGLIANGARADSVAARLRELRRALNAVSDDVADGDRVHSDDERIARELVDALNSPLPPEEPREARTRAHDESSYRCPSCGESIVVPVDPSEGAEQRYVEDCPVCCRPNVIHVEIVEEGEAPRLWAESE